MAAPSVSFPLSAGASDPNVEINVTEVASFVGLRQCGRFLRLSSARNSPRSVSGEFRDYSISIDEALKAAGRQLEDEVVAELQRRAPNAPHSNPCRPAESSTTWTAFLDLISGAPIAPSSHMGCWAAEVVLRGRPISNSVVSLSGRADFIVLLWRSGRPVLRIVECKASMEPQTKYIVQLVLYRMLLLELLHHVAAASTSGNGVCIGSRVWSLPGEQVASGNGALQVECLLRTKVSGAAGHAADGVALPAEEVEAITRQLSGMLMPGGRIAEALNIHTPLAEVPYELDTHCGMCNRSAECWLESAARGAVQLSGCGASEAQRLAKAGVRDIEDLAALVLMHNGVQSVPLAPVERGRWTLEDVAADSGIAPGELQRLSLRAAVRMRRLLRHPRSFQHFPGFQQQQPPFKLLPGAPPSGFPSLAVSGSLVRVYVSVAMDVILHRVVGVAAHIAAPTLGIGGDQGRLPVAPLQEKQAGWDITLLLEGVTLKDGPSSAIATPEEQMDDLEARLLADFSDQLCDAIQQCAEMLQHQRQHKGKHSGEPPLQQGQQLKLHFYFHSRQEVRELLRRCSTLDDQLSLREMADLRTDPSRGDGKSTNEIASSIRGGSISSPSFGAWSSELSGSATRDVGLSWLPHLLGLRADVGDLQEKAGADTSQEQSMMSVIEDEVRRYATVWQGAGRLAATSVAWGGDSITYDWRVPPLPPRQLQTGTVKPGGAAACTNDDDIVGRDLRAVFRPGGYLNCFVLDSLDLRRGLEQLQAPQQQSGRWPRHGIMPANPRPRRHRQPAATSSFAPAVQEAVSYAQIRPDLSGVSIPPSFFRALWSGQKPSRSDGPQHDERKDVFQQGAALLGGLLLAQAHAVRWVEERLVRLPDCGNSRLRKVPLALPSPLRRSLRAFRLDTANLPGGPRRAAQGPHGLRATSLARAAMDAVWLDRGSQMLEFWRGLGSQPPAARAADNCSGAIVLDRLQRMNERKAYWLQGRVVAPEGCHDWESLSKATGLEEGSSVVVTAVANNPWICQDAEKAHGCYAHGDIYPSTAASLHKGASGRQLLETAAGDKAELWICCRLSRIRYPQNGLFLLGSEKVWPWTFAAAGGPGAQVVLDAAPNISGWVATSIIEVLQEFGGGSAYLAERLWLSLSPSDIAGVGSPGQTEEVTIVEDAGTGASEEGPLTPMVKLSGASAAARDYFPNCLSPPGASTPASLFQGQQLLSGPQVPFNSDRLVNGCCRSQTLECSTAGSADSADDAGPSNSGASDRVDGPGVDELVQRLAPELDQDQASCVRAFLEHPQGGARVLLQGPPGTGKTETVAVALLAWLTECMRHGGPMGLPEQGGVVLLSGPTHAAIDNLMKRIAVRLGVGARDGGALRERTVLVRLDSTRRTLDPALADLGVMSSLPKAKDWRKGTWYLVGSTMRHLAKAAKEVRTLAASSASHQGAELMERSGRAAFASALLLDEASMLFAPQLLALGCMLVMRGSLLVAGDHEQLSTIVSYDFDQEQRPNLARHRPFVSAYEYVQLMAREEARLRRGQSRVQEEDDIPFIGGRPPPVSMCALSYSHRLPCAVRSLIQPLYSQDGITLRGRPPMEKQAAMTAVTTNATTTITSGPAISIPCRNIWDSRFAARPADAVASASTVEHSTLGDAQPLARHLTRGGRANFSHPGNAEAGCVWRTLWKGNAEEGLFLVMHNEEGSSRYNAWEVQLVAEMLQARPCSSAGAQRGCAERVSGGKTAVAASGSDCGNDEANEGTAAVSVALITPHRAQRRALQALVKARGWGQDCQVDTVERMQGGEAETVIFSATVSDTATLERSEEFYSSIRRANVAFSRARRRLIVVASRAFLSYLPTSYKHFSGLLLWRHLQYMCQDRGTYLGSEHMMWDRSYLGSTSATTAADEAYGRQPGTALQGSRSGDGELEQGPAVTLRCDVYVTA